MYKEGTIVVLKLIDALKEEFFDENPYNPSIIDRLGNNAFVCMINSDYTVSLVLDTDGQFRDTDDMDLEPVMFLAIYELHYFEHATLPMFSSRKLAREFSKANNCSVMDLDKHDRASWLHKQNCEDVHIAYQRWTCIPKDLDDYICTHKQ